MEIDGKKLIEYRFLDVDNEVLYTNELEYREALRGRAGRAIERVIPNYEHGQCLIAGGVKTMNDFGDKWSEFDAMRICRKLSRLITTGIDHDTLDQGG